MAGSYAPAGAGSAGGDAPCLIVERPAHLAGTRWPLTRPAHIVGRYGDIRLSSPDVSKRHAELRRGSDGVWLNDLNSSNGVLRNGRRMEPGRPVRLKDGDRLQFGSLELTFRQFDAMAPDTVTVDADVTHLNDYRTRHPAGSRPDPGLPPPPPNHAPAPPVDDDARSMTTRQLAASTQLVPGFADLVIRQVVDEPYRALAPVFGADLGVVTRWALAARRRRLVRDLVLATVLVGLMALLGHGVLTHRDDLTNATGATGATDWWRPYATVGALLLGVGWLTVAVEMWTTEYLVLRRRLSARHFDPGQAPQAWSGRAQARLAAVAERPAGNLIVCSHYCPFAGSGFLVDDWDRPIDIRKGMPLGNGRRESPRPFTVGELYDVLIAAARRIGLDNLRVAERLFVDGLNVTQDRGLLPDPLRPPLTRVDRQVIRLMPDGLGATKRSYVSIEVPAWGGALVVTMYLRAVQVRGTLYLEWSAYALLPMLPEYYAVDGLPHRTSLGCALSAAFRAAVQLPPALLRSPMALARRFGYARRAAAHRRRQRRAIRAGHPFDYGAEYSIREIACGADEGTYFLGRDLSRALHTTQQHLLNTIGDFLESRGIDSENFQRVQQNLVQNFNDYSVHQDNRIKARNISGGNLAPGGNVNAGGPAPPTSR